MLRKLGIGSLGVFAALALSLGGCGDDDGAECGDGVIEGSESCDGSALGGETCETQGFASGTLACDTATCGFDTGGCTNVTQECGNDQAEGTEDCDGADLDGNTCADLGFTGGNLACNEDCTFDDVGCNNLCGNGTLDALYETCDTDDFGIAACGTEGTFDGGTLTCSADCQTITTNNCCNNSCTPDGDTGCNGTVLETCETQADGCLGITSYDCDDDSQVCDDSGATAVCGDACTPDCTVVDETRCASNNAETCTDDSGCLTWQVTDACTAGSEVCVMAGLQATCLASGGGDSCADAEVVISSVAVSGTDFFTDYTDSNDWGPNTGCGSASGPDAVFQVWLESGDVVHFSESGNLDAVLRVMDTCDATSTCLVSYDIGEDRSYEATTTGYHWVVIEAYFSSSSSSAYDILVEVFANETDCGDGVDNDMDGNTDCDDSNCFGDTTHCTTETNCSDGADNDGDNDVDCADSDCVGVGNCEATETSCDDSFDNDSDGQVDCADSDCASAPACVNQIGFWEEFTSSSAVDLDDCTIAFTPDATTYQYTYTCGIGGLPITAGTGSVDSTTLTLLDSNSVEVTIQGAWSFDFFGLTYTSFWVGSNGFVTFGSGDDYSDSSASTFFDFPRIAGFDYDLDPGSGGTVTVDEFADYIVITFAGVEDYWSTDTVTFQIVMHSNGDIDLHYGTLEILDDGMVGLSNGGALGTAPASTDFVLPPPAAGELVITEIMFNPSITEPTGEWVEVYNASSHDIDLWNCTFQDNTASNMHTFSSLVIPAGGYFVLSNNDDPSLNGGLTGTYAVGGAMALANGTGDIITIECGVVTVAVVDFQGWSLGSNGTAIQLTSLVMDEVTNDLEAAWCDATATYGTANDNGTPGAANNDCGFTSTSLLSEDFSGTFPPTGWSVVDGGDAGYSWDVCDGCSFTLNGATGRYAYIDSDIFGVDFDDELVTPSVDCGAYAFCELSFLHYFHYYSGDYGDVDVSIGGGAWTNMVSYTANTTNGEVVTLAIPGAGGQADVRIRFRYVANNDFHWLIDDVTIICY